MATQTQVAAPATGRPCGRCLASSRARYGHPHVCCARPYCCGIPEHQADIERIWSLRVPTWAQEVIGSVANIRYQLDDNPVRWLVVNVRIDGFAFAPSLPNKATEWFWGRYA